MTTQHRFVDIYEPIEAEKLDTESKVIGESQSGEDEGTETEKMKS
jgi:hypothetical protein